MKKMLIVIICLGLLVSCINKEKEEELSEKVDIRIGCTTYPSSYAQAVLFREIINRQGYSSRIIQEDTNDMWNSLSKGETDVVLSSWIPTIDSKRRSKAQASIKDLGSNCRNLSNGIYVPDYTSIGFLSELNNYIEDFKRTIYVCKESDITINETKVMLEKYNVEYEIIQVHYNEIDQLISKAIENKEWIAVALWTPNGKIDKYNLRQLRDTMGIYTYNIDTHTIINNNYDNEELLSILDNYYIRQGELNELINILYENDNEKKTVTTWLDNNLQVINRLY